MSISHKSVFFIGGGNMASAIIAGLDRDYWRVIVAEVSDEQREKVKQLYNVETTDKPDEKIADVDVIVLAVKPQVIHLVLESLSKFDLSNKIILSIMAGVTISTIRAPLKGDNIKYVRTMPNTPLMVGKGVTGVFLTDESAKEQVEKLFGATGVVIFVKTEEDLNKVTAISGSGPAYFFLFIECLSKAAQEMGFEKEIADKMAIGTALGASTLSSQSDLDVSILRSNVTSKGGTTEQAILSFIDQGLEEVVKKATDAALKRSIELAKESE